MESYIQPRKTGKASRWKIYAKTPSLLRPRCTMGCDHLNCIPILLKDSIKANRTSADSTDGWENDHQAQELDLQCIDSAGYYHDNMEGQDDNFTNVEPKTPVPPGKKQLLVEQSNVQTGKLNC